MANDIGGNPWIIDTASATAVYSGKIKVVEMKWHEPTTAGHQLIVTDKNGRVIWHKYALAGGSGFDYDGPYVGGWIDGLIVPTLGSGELHVYIE